MSIYDIDYNNVVENLTPSHRRTPKWLAWLQEHLVPLQWRHDITFTEYANGSDMLWPYFDRLRQYVKGDRVIGMDGAVYEANMNFPPLYDILEPEWDDISIFIMGDVVGRLGQMWVSLTNGNHNHVPENSPTFWKLFNESIDPALYQPAWQRNITYAAGTFAFYQGTNYVALTGNKGNVPGTDRVNWKPAWIKICDSYLGVNERLTYNAQKVVLERALNRLFNPVLAGYGADQFSDLTAYDIGTFVTHLNKVYYKKANPGAHPFLFTDWVEITRTTFRQPMFSGDWLTALNRSDIYIDDNDWEKYFMIGGADGDSNLCYAGETSGNGYIYDNNDAQNPMFTVHVPNTSTGSLIPGFYDWLNGTPNPNGTNPYQHPIPDPNQAVKIISQAVLRYAIAGTTFSVTTY